MTRIVTSPKLQDAYTDALPGSRALFERARRLFPDAVTHDTRRMQPFPLYVDRADGALKWDVDGRRYVDFWMGHGALLFGHNPAHVRDAVREQMMKGTHYGACHAGEVEWGEWVCRLVPSAERVRFTASGTEATHMALRLARAFTGKRHVVKFAGHFHGWHEGVEIGVHPPYDAEPEAGQLAEVVALVSVLPPNDIAAVRERLAKGDVAAVILEPTGGHFGAVPAPASFVAALREETRRAGVLLVFDEVVTGFRVAPGGAQEKLGVTPDLTTLAKILAGGLPGGAVVGREDVLAYLATKPDPEQNRRSKISHHGTFNANPLSAAAGVAMLAAVADGQAIRFADAQAAKLRHAMTEVLAREKVAWRIYGESSDWKIFFGADTPPRDGADQSVREVDWRRLDARHAAQSRALRQALILNGVDFNGSRALVGTCHTDEIVAETVAAFEGAVRAMKDEGLAAP
ncbi:MAG: aminotransferase class III-fold pyridoxal phosphate-dependent enzyme [Candidatus Rokubacteria bacterium]|nr:aminotransferase class III-fold pyridoxal phosphate-dependent enzyme [Candidatus Rokubacteria bacterium]